MLYPWMHKGTVDVQRSVWASCEMNINSPCSPVFQSTEHLLPLFIFVIPVPTHLANKQIEYCHVVCSNVFFRLDFSLCGNILSHRKKLQDSKLISWVGPEQTNYRCENALREATQSGTKGCGQTQLTWHSKVQVCGLVWWAHSCSLVKALQKRRLNAMTKFSPLLSLLHVTKKNWFKK